MIFGGNSMGGRDAALWPACAALCLAGLLRGAEAQAANTVDGQLQIECVQHEAYRTRIEALEAELAMYRDAATSGSIVCTGGGGDARLQATDTGYSITNVTSNLACEDQTSPVLNLHMTENAEIELPGLLVRITDVMNSTWNITDAEETDDLWDPGQVSVVVPGLDIEVGMDVWCVCRPLCSYRVLQA
jgi:hypothetical protein